MTPIAKYRDRKDALVRALRSGKYKQGKEWLHNGYDEFCCLGVACALLDWMKPKAPEGHDHYVYAGHARSLPPSVQRYYGFTSPLGGFEGGNLVVLNDQGMPFPEIADIIGSEPKGLFTWSDT